PKSLERPRRHGTRRSELVREVVDSDVEVTRRRRKWDLAPRARQERDVQENAVGTSSLPEEVLVRNIGKGNRARQHGPETGCSIEDVDRVPMEGRGGVPQLTDQKLLGVDGRHVRRRENVPTRGWTGWWNLSYHSRSLGVRDVHDQSPLRIAAR